VSRPLRRRILLAQSLSGKGVLPLTLLALATMDSPSPSCATRRPVLRVPRCPAGPAHRRLPTRRQLAAGGGDGGAVLLPLWLGLLLLYLLLADRVTTAHAASRDLYDVLGVARSADSSTIKRAFRKLSIKYHPDKNAGDKNAESAYVEITSAYEVLSNKQKRNVYDRYGHEGLKNNAGSGRGSGGGMDPFGDDEDGGFFDNFFGTGGGRRQRQQEARSPDMVIPLTVSLDAMYNGEVVQASRQRQVICSSWSDCESRCMTCGGTGYTVTTRRIGPGFIQQVRSSCLSCGGSGKIVTECSTCPHGQFEQAEQVLLIEIVRGAFDGQRVAFEEMADELPGHATGSLVFVVDEVPHETFRRDGDDLHVRLPLTLAEALVGVDRSVTHLDGRAVSIKTAGVTKPLHKQRVAGQGMPRADGDSAGDLVVEFWVDFPEKLTDAQQEAVVAVFGAPPKASELAGVAAPVADGAEAKESKEEL